MEIDFRNLLAAERFVKNCKALLFQVIYNKLPLAIDRLAGFSQVEL